MGLFSKRKKPETFHLTQEDFKTTTETFTGSSAISEPGKELKPEDWEESTTELTTSEAEISLYGQSIDISFDPNKLEMDLDAYLTLVNEKLNWLGANREKVEEAIADELLELKNESWLDEDERPVSKKTFIKRLVIESIEFYSDSSAELWFDDGDLFWGHAVTIDLTVNLELEDASLSG